MAKVLRQQAGRIEVALLYMAVFTFFWVLFLKADLMMSLLMILLDALGLGISG